MIKLVRLNKQYKKQLIEMMDEWTKYNERIIPFALTRIDYHYFDLYMNNIEKLEQTKTKVPSLVYFCLDTTQNIFLGAVTIRLQLTDELLLRGGHISDGIRPSKRNQGYGTILVKLAIEECKKLGIKDVLMVCEQNNIPSVKTIINNNGYLENEYKIENTNIIIQRYWIKTGGKNE